MIVVDASVAIKWSVVEPGHEEARALVSSLTPLAAPSIIVPEVANVLRKKAKRQEIEWNQAELSVMALPRTIGRLIDISAFGDRLMALVRRLDHAPYDCCYLLCAADLQATFLTEDRVLAAKAKLAGVEAFALSDWRRA